MRAVSIIGAAQLPVRKESPLSLRQMAAQVTRQALAHAGADRVDALFAGNMLSDELQNQKHLAALIADEAGLPDVEALAVRAATASGAAALRIAYLAVASGQAEVAIAVGVEKMSGGAVTRLLAKALDDEIEVAAGATMISQSAHLMRLYLERYRLAADALASFPVQAHANALYNANALFQKAVTPAEVMNARIIADPIRLFDCAPVCDGAAAVVLAPGDQAHKVGDTAVSILASTVATDRFRIMDRPDPLTLRAAQLSAGKAYRQAGLTAADVDLFEAHDAFSIITCLQLEAAGFAAPGEGWRLGVDGEIGIHGRVPISTMGGLKARGHPIGATALYQVCEIVAQLTGQAGPTQVPQARVALMQSVGGVATTVITHLFGGSRRQEH
jgi:acetyl-CoA C-acetyltransferase